jgi:hypothetical protein
MAIQSKVVAFGWVAQKYMWPKSIWPSLSLAGVQRPAVLASLLQERTLDGKDA